MNVTPISMQMMFPQSNEAGNVQSNMQNQVNIQQSFESVRQKQDAELARQQVRAKEQASEDSRVKDDPERERRQGRGNGGESRRGDTQDRGLELLQRLARDPNRGVHLDISL
ncbi:hypothetical protein [Selenomonas dianae]|nr:hypothetical protein [uncultured Selenomonas sp.]